MPRHSSRRAPIGQSWYSTRCLGWERPWRRCWWRLSSAWAPWWLLPAAVATILALVSAVALREPLRGCAGIAAANASALTGWGDLPRRFWLYAAAVFLYGIVETLNGNWAMLYLSGERGVSTQGASFALTAFWVMVTVGRVLIALISRRVPARWIYLALPILLVSVFQLASRVEGEAGGMLAFGLAGLACSAFLPLSISFGGSEFPQLSAVMAGELIAFYQLGYGVAAFGIGPLRDLIGLAFSTIMAAGSIVAAPLAIIALFVIRRPTSGHFDYYDDSGSLQPNQRPCWHRRARAG
jgi:MFS transporter, FHS family, glucose/mannose:H+ symporter